MPSYPLQDVALAVIIGTPLLATCFVGLRIYSRRKFATYLGWDDYTIILATLLSIALIYPSVRFIKMWHFGLHIWQVNQRQIEPDYDEFHIILLTFNLLNTPILPLIKASLIILLLRVSTVLPLLRRTLYLIFIFNAITCLIPFIILIFQCPPQTGNTWKPRVFGELKCMSRPRIGQVQVFQTSANFVTDLCVVPIPWVLVRGLERTSRWTRGVIVFLFALSLGVTAIGAAKIYLTYEDRLYNISASDWTYNISLCINHAENNTAIIVACIPALRGLIMRWIRRPDADEEEIARIRRGGPRMGREVVWVRRGVDGGDGYGDGESEQGKRWTWRNLLRRSAKVESQKRDSCAKGLPSDSTSTSKPETWTPPPSYSSAPSSPIKVSRAVGKMPQSPQIVEVEELGVLGRERSYSFGETGLERRVSAEKGNDKALPELPATSPAVSPSRALFSTLAAPLGVPPSGGAREGSGRSEDDHGVGELEFITVKDGIL